MWGILLPEEILQLLNGSLKPTARIPCLMLVGMLQKENQVKGPTSCITSTCASYNLQRTKRACVFSSLLMLFVGMGMVQDFLHLMSHALFPARKFAETACSDARVVDFLGF